MSHLVAIPLLMKTKSNIIADVLRELLPATARIVDIGFAQTPNTDLRGEVHGIDLVAAPVPENYTAVHVCDLNTDRLPFEDESVDAVTMGCTLAHVAHPLRVLSDINRVLKNEGVLVISSPNPNYYWENVLNIFYHSFKSRVSKAKHLEHFFEFSRYNMRTIGERSGFMVIDELGVSFRLVKTSLRFNVLRLPGLAYEIVYVLRKTGSPESFATFESGDAISRVPTNLFG